MRFNPVVSSVGLVLLASSMLCAAGPRGDHIPLNRVGVVGGATGGSSVSLRTKAGKEYRRVPLVCADSKSVVILYEGKEKKIPRVFIRPEDSKKIPNVARKPAEKKEPLVQSQLLLEAVIGDTLSNGFFSTSYRFVRWGRAGRRPFTRKEDWQFGRVFVQGPKGSTLVPGETWTGLIAGRGSVTNDASGNYRLVESKSRK